MTPIMGVVKNLKKQTCGRLLWTVHKRQIEKTGKTDTIICDQRVIFELNLESFENPLNTGLGESLFVLTA